MGAVLNPTLKILVCKGRSMHLLLTLIGFLLFQELLLPTPTEFLELDCFLFDTEHSQKSNCILTQSEECKRDRVNFESSNESESRCKHENAEDVPHNSKSFESLFAALVNECSYKSVGLVIDYFVFCKCVDLIGKLP